MTSISAHRDAFRAVATTVVPESSSLDEGGWAEVEGVVDAALAARDERTRRQFVAFLRLLQVLPVARYGHRLTRLDSVRRALFLSSLERSPVLLVRRGFWGLRTLIFMGYYTRDDVAREIGYRADVRGWAARGGTVASVPLPPGVWVEP